MNICGIYKITSPTDKIYVGQSLNINRRFNTYKSNIELLIKQPKLYNSIKKHGWENHTFEVIEECEIEDLNCRERYWQDFYDVLNGGLNCVLTQTNLLPYRISEESRKIKSESKKGDKNPNSKDILNPYIGVYYGSISEAQTTTKVSKSYLKDMLKGVVKNKTDLIYADDYEIGFLPHTLFSNRIRKSSKIREGYQVINYETKESEGSIKEVSKKLNIKEATFRSFLTGVVKNKTIYILKKDFDKGLNPKSMCKSVEKEPKINKRIGERKIKKIIDLNNGEVFKTNKECSKKLCLSVYTINKILNFKQFNTLNIIYEDDYLNGLLPNSKCNIKNKNSIAVIDLRTNKVYKSIRQACTDLKLPNQTVSEKLLRQDYKNLTLRYNK
jgi:group I intron endonuclease